MSKHKKRPSLDGFLAGGVEFIVVILMSLIIVATLTTLLIGISLI